MIHAIYLSIIAFMGWKLWQSAIYTKWLETEARNEVLEMFKRKPRKTFKERLAEEMAKDKASNDH